MGTWWIWIGGWDKKFIVYIWLAGLQFYSLGWLDVEQCFFCVVKESAFCSPVVGAAEMKAPSHICRGSFGEKIMVMNHLLFKSLWKIFMWIRESSDPGSCFSFVPDRNLTSISFEENFFADERRYLSCWVQEVQVWNRLYLCFERNQKIGTEIFPSIQMMGRMWKMIPFLSLSL